MGHATVVAVVQEYVPAYRSPFFAALRTELSHRGIDLLVAAGRPNRATAKREDAKHEQIDFTVRQKEFRLGGRRVVLRLLPRAVRQADVLVLEQARRNLDTYWWLLNPLHRRREVVLWGHGADYSRPVGRVSTLLLRQMTKRAIGFFAYTERGRRDVIASGYPNSRITVLNNSTDTRALRYAFASLTTDQICEWRELHRLGEGHAYAFIGSLTEGKGLDLLGAAWAIFHKRNSDTTLLVCGSGPASASLLGPDGDPIPGVRLLGYADDVTKAFVGATCRALVVPGQVGLVAVDALVLGLPILSIRTNHGPEIDYLAEGRSLFTVDAEPDSLASAMEEMSAKDESGDQLVPDLTLGTEQMAVAFARGVERALESGLYRPTRTRR